MKLEPNRVPPAMLNTAANYKLTNPCTVPSNYSDFTKSAIATLYLSVLLRLPEMPPPTTLNSPIFHCCQKVTVLSLPSKPTALSLLTRASDQVRPLMQKRRWSVPLLCEFYPPTANLLGLNYNHGAKIEIRLRSASSVSRFLPYESILGTLLHELAHIQVGPHNASFYKVLDDLKRECDEIRMKGDDGSGLFVGKGRRVGEGVSRNVSRASARERGVEAAERRRRVGGIMGKHGGVRLGGMAEVARLCDPREMALAAAQRRMMDDVWCGNSEHGRHAERENQKEEGRKDEVVVIEEESEDEVEVVKEIRVKRGERRKGSASQVPVRENAAALAALQRAWMNET